MAKHKASMAKSGIEARLKTVGLELRGALVPIIRQIAGSSPRPARLSHHLKIDRTLASRLARAFRAEDPLEFMHIVPSPHGLRLFLAAAARAGIEPDVRKGTEKAVSNFQVLIDETPGGRATLNASVSASSYEARTRNERTSKQAIYKGMAYVLGIQCDVMASAFIMRPSLTPNKVDSIDVSHRIGMRRLRPTAPIGLLSHRLHARDTDLRDTELRFETLDGERAEDVHAFFLREFCSDPLPKMDIFETSIQATIALSEDGPPPEAPFDLTFAAIIRNTMGQYYAGKSTHTWRSYLLHCPCKILVRDVFIRDDLYVGVVPEITLHIPSPMGPETVRRSGSHGRMDTVDMATPIDHLGTGLANVDVREMPSYARLLRHVFDRAGWDPSRYRGYRTVITYPVPLVYMNWWFELPQPPIRDSARPSPEDK